MNFSKLKSTMLMALGALAMLTPQGASAAPVANDGDIFVGVHASGNQGASNDYIINLGPASTLEGYTSTTALSLGGVGADLSLIYGSNWATRTDVLWGAVGTVGHTAGTYAANTTYATRARITAGTQSTPWNRTNPTAQGIVTNKVLEMMVAFNDNTRSFTTFFDGSSTQNLQSTKAVQQDTSALNGWVSYLPTQLNGNLAFTQYSAAFEGSNASGITNTTMDLYRMVQGSGQGALVGALTIANTGVITFTPASVLSPPGVSFAKSTDSVSESVVGGTYTMTINRAGSTAGTASVQVTSVDGTALAGTDYTAYDQVINFAANQSTASVVVTITNRNGAASARNFKLHFSNPSSGLAIGADSTITINPYVAPSVAFASLTPTVAESAGTLTVTVNRSGDTGATNTVNVSTVDGTAVAGTDFTAISNQTISFAPGDTQKTFTVTITNRFNQAANRSFGLHFSSPSSGFTAGGDATVTITSTVLQSTVEFAAASTTVNASGTVPSVTLTVNRYGGNSAESLTVTANDGTAQVTRDFSAPSSTVSFTAVNGTTPTAGSPQTATITINLLHPAGAPLRTFTVTLSGASSNVTLGSATTSTINVAAADLVNPTVAITAPTAGQVLPAAPAVGGPTTDVAISGTASDNVAVSSVNIVLNGVTTSVVPSGGTWSFHTTVNANKGLRGGVNKVTVTSVDSSGNTSLPSSLSFSLLEKGTLTTAVVPSSGAGGSVTGKLASYTVGTSATLVAKPTAGFQFDHWTIPGVASNDPSTKSPNLTFVYSDAILASPTITATFVATKFSQAKMGTYNGLLVPHQSTGNADPRPTSPANNSTVGLVTVNVTGSGSFSGTLKVDGLSKSFTGAFDTDGAARFGANGAFTVFVPRDGKSSVELSLNMVNLTGASGAYITGIVNQYKIFPGRPPIATSDLLLEKAFFSASVPLSGANATNYLKNSGNYTFILPAKAQNGLNANEFPQGTGVGTIKLTAAGAVNFTGTLADGATFSGSSVLSFRDQQKLQTPVFASPSAYSGKGSFGGLLTFDAGQANSDVKAPDCFWFAPFNGGQYYPWGWEDGVLVDLMGASYSTTLAPVLPGVGSLTIASAANVLLASDAGDLTGPVKSFHLTGANVVTKVPLATDKTYNLTVTSGTGKLAGNVPLSDGTSPAFQGIIYQKGASAGGYGFFQTVKPTVVDGLGISGKVTVSAAAQ